MTTGMKKSPEQSLLEEFFLDKNRVTANSSIVRMTMFGRTAPVNRVDQDVNRNLTTSHKPSSRS